jgi:hypothetical protein
LMTALALAATAACSGDMPSAPVAPSLDVAAPSLAKGGRAESSPAAPQTYTIQVNTGVSKVYYFGQSWVYIPAGAICAEGSGYGPELWDASCTSASGQFELQVTVRSEQGMPVAEFYPDVRFARGNSARWSDWVILGLKVQGNLNDKLGYGILYKPTGGNRWIDESLDDPTLKSWRASGNVIARRLKHFSGYNVSLGFDEQAPVGFGEIGGIQ